MILSYLIDWGSISKKILRLDLNELIPLQNSLNNLGRSVGGQENGLLLRDPRKEVIRSLNDTRKKINDLIEEGPQDTLESVLFTISLQLSQFDNYYTNNSVQFPAPEDLPTPQPITTWLAFSDMYLKTITEGYGSVAGVLITSLGDNEMNQISSAASSSKGYFRIVDINRYCVSNPSLDVEIERLSWRDACVFKRGEEGKFLRYINSYSISSTLSLGNPIVLIDPYLVWFYCPRSLTDKDSLKRRNQQLYSLIMILRPFVHNEEIENIQIISGHPKILSERPSYCDAMGDNGENLDLSVFSDSLKAICSHRKNDLSIRIVITSSGNGDEELHNRYISNGTYCISFLKGLEFCTNNSNFTFRDKGFRVGNDGHTLPGQFRDSRSVKRQISQISSSPRISITLGGR